jgi:hypothetical protein
VIFASQLFFESSIPEFHGRSSSAVQAKRYVTISGVWCSGGCATGGVGYLGRTVLGYPEGETS